MRTISPAFGKHEIVDVMILTQKLSYARHQ